MAVAILVVFASTFVYTYLTANFTSLILRFNSKLEAYRTRLQTVDQYLRRNQVSREVRKRVKRHFRCSLENDQTTDAQLLDQMPHSLRRQLVGSAWTRARRDGNPTHGASTRLRFCNKVCLACAGDAQSCSGDAGSLVSTSEAAGVTIDLCSIRRWFTVHACVGAALASLRAAEGCL